MADQKFSAQVDEIITKTEKRMQAVIRQSIQDVIDDAQTPVGKGGRMRVDTGFLRASGQLSFNGMPSGPSRGDKSGKYNYSEGSVEVSLAQLTIGQTIFFGWTAAYARYREAKDGFLSGAVQNWQSIVAKNVAAVVARIK